MKLISHRNSYLQFRFIMAILLSIGTIVADNKFGMFNQVRMYVDTAVSFLYFISNRPYRLFDDISRVFSSRSQLEFENRALRRELFLKNSELLVFFQYKQENIRLRELLNSPLLSNERKMMTKVISSISDSHSNQIIIDKGSIDGVYEGQPVINDKGVVGQVIAVSKLTSRVLLICDKNHALPIQVLRNDIRVIATGKGYASNLQLECLPENTDIRVGDVLVTSGLGGCFPAGYLVAIVSSVTLDNQHSYTVIQASPTANLQNLHYLLLIWSTNRGENNLKTPEEVRFIVNERKMSTIPSTSSKQITNLDIDKK